MWSPVHPSPCIKENSFIIYISGGGMFKKGVVNRMFDTYDEAKDYAQRKYYRRQREYDGTVNWSIINVKDLVTILEIDH
jgi:hypothetical protein